MAKFPLKELLILLSLAGSYAAIGERLASVGLTASLLAYLGLFALLAACLLLAAQVRIPLLRWCYALIFAAAAFYLESYERITSEHLTYDAFINLLHSSQFAAEAARQHRALLIGALVNPLLLFAGIALKPRRRVRSAFAAAPIGGIALLAAILFVRGGEGARGLPSPFAPLAYSGIYAWEAATGAAGARRPVQLHRDPRPVTRDIVLIVDESVAGNYLDLGSSNGIRSGLAEPRPGLAVHNYGYAASITNCSVGTNVTLRHGGTRGDYRRINTTMPSIWDYAHRAGLRTVYIDAQRTDGILHNLMSEDELAEIDRFVQFDGVPVRDRDMAAADRLAALINDGRPQLIIVNKVGAHFPVHDKYPDAFMRYRPALPRGGYEEISDTGSREGFGGAAEDWLRYRNSYRNTLLWNVGAFFDRLLAKADLTRATIIYTSDHGQDLHERGDPGLNTHCGSDPMIEEGLVPLVVIEGGAPTQDWRRHLAANRNHVSHYEIFPTLLALMGYNDPKLRAIYGESLLERSHDDFTFNARFNARLGLEPNWRFIDLEKVVQPPRGDAAEPKQSL